jgi:hypothetical protein
MRNVSKPRVNDARDRTLTDEELACLQDAARDVGPRGLAMHPSRCAQRSAARGVWGLRVSDIDFAQSTVHLSNTKNADAPSPMAREALQRLVAAAERRCEDRLIPVGDAVAVVWPQADPRPCKVVRKEVLTEECC